MLKSNQTFTDTLAAFWKASNPLFKGSRYRPCVAAPGTFAAIQSGDLIATNMDHQLTAQGIGVTFPEMVINGELFKASKGLEIREAVGSAPADLPKWPFDAQMERDATAEFVLPTAALKAIGPALSEAISKEGTRYYLTGVNLETGDFHSKEGSDLIAVSTDGHRMAMARLLTDVSFALDSCIVPANAWNALCALAAMKGAPETIEARFTLTGAIFKMGQIVIATKLIDGTYPDWRMVVPDHSAAHGTEVFAADPIELKKSMRPLLPMAHDRTKAIAIEHKGGHMLETTFRPVGDGEPQAYPLPLYAAEGSGRVGFNGTYLRDAMTGFNSRIVLTGASEGKGEYGPGFSPSKPLKIMQTGGHAYALQKVLMPMRV